MDDKTKMINKNQSSDQSIKVENELTSMNTAYQTAKTTATIKKSTDEKNFRTSYYSKVGLGNDEEKIDALLNPVDIDKIKMYIKTYSIPDAQRVKIWKLLLGMTTAKGDDEYTSELRKTSYENLFKCLTVIGKLTSETSPVDRNVLIYRFEDDKLNHPKNFISQTVESLTKISESIVKNFKVTDEDLFHIYSSFINLINSYQHLYSQLVEEVLHMVAKEDVEYEKFLRKSQVVEIIKTMFSRCLAGILDSNLIIRLWDKVVAGYFRLLLPKIVYFILINEKHHLIKTGDFLSLLNVIPKEKLDHRILSLI